VGPIAILVVL